MPVVSIDACDPDAVMLTTASGGKISLFIASSFTYLSLYQGRLHGWTTDILYTRMGISTNTFWSSSEGGNQAWRARIRQGQLHHIPFNLLGNFQQIAGIKADIQILPVIGHFNFLYRRRGFRRTGRQGKQIGCQAELYRTGLFR